jgi:hypothetical protein
MDLREAGVREVRAALVRAPRRGDVARLRVRREVEDVAVAAGREQHRVAGVTLELAREQVPRDETARDAVDDDEIEHLAAREDLEPAGADLAHHRAVGAEEELLAGLTARVERPRDLRAAERAVREQPAVLARERDAERDAVVDDLVADLREAVHVALARAEVAALDRVVEEAEDAVAVVRVVLGRVDPALRGDAVRAARRVLDAQRRHAVAELRERGGSGAAGEAGADDEDVELAAVRGVDELQVELVARPALRHRTAGDLRREDLGGGRGVHEPPPASRKYSGNDANPSPKRTATAQLARSRRDSGGGD